MRRKIEEIAMTGANGSVHRPGAVERKCPLVEYREGVQRFITRS